MLSRRTFNEGLLLFSLGSAFQTKLLAAESDEFDMEGWIVELDELGVQLREGDIEPRAWQEGMDRLYGAVDIPQLLGAIDFEELSSQIRFQGRLGEASLPVQVNGSRLHLHTKIFQVKKGRSIIPHGHSNMVSAFLTISGEFHTRMYDRVDMDEDHLYIRQTADKEQPVGDWSSISGQWNNVHWLTALTDDTYLFSCQLFNLDPDARTGRIPIDPFGDNEGDGIVKARRIGNAESQEKFG